MTVSAMVAATTSSVSARWSSTTREAPGIERAPSHASTRSTSAVEPGGIRARRLAHEMRADHRRQRQRHHHRDRDREGQRDREFAEHAADHAGHEQQRNEGGDQRDADRQHGEADLPRALDRGPQRRHALLEIAEAVLDHDDGVVDHEADRDRERHQRQVVDREAGDPHHRAGAGERQRHRDAGGDASPRRAAGTRTPPASPDDDRDAA